MPTVRDPLSLQAPEAPDQGLGRLVSTLVGSEILRIAREVRELQATGRPVLNLTVGDFAPREFRIHHEFADAIGRALADGQTNYPPSDGVLELREAVRSFYAQALGLDYPIESVLVAGGARPLIWGAYRSIVDEGDKVVFPVPSWNNNHYCHLVGARGVAVPTRPENGFLPTAEELAPHLEGAVLLALNSPLNPAGSGFGREQLTAALKRRGVLAFALGSRGGLAALGPRQPGLLVLRTVTNLGAAFLFFSSLRYLPLADAFAIAFAAPLFVTGLSVPVLGEHVGIRRWAAVIVGFVGVVIVVQPGSESFQPAALLPLGAAFSYALSMLLGRKLTRSLPTPAIMLWPSLGIVLIMAVMMPQDWRTPTLPDAGIFLFMGIVGTLGAALITQGYRHAPAAVIAPFDYSVLLWGVLFGWLLWHEVPGPNVWIGSTLLIASGLYILHRETRKPRPVQPVPGPLGPTV